MPKPTGPTNPELRKSVEKLRNKKSNFHRYVARLLEKNKSVNISKINRMCKDKDIIVVPGKVLSTGDIDKSVVVYAFSFSKTARGKIEKAKGKSLDMNDLLKDNIKPRIIV